MAQLLPFKVGKNTRPRFPLEQRTRAGYFLLLLPAMPPHFYGKAAMPVAHQIELLKSRGLTINDIEFAQRVLRQIGFFRLSQYWHPLQSGGDEHIFSPGSKLEQVVDIYHFDADLRANIFRWIEGIEVLIRAKLADEISEIYGPYWIQESHNFRCSVSIFDLKMESIKREYNRSREVFILNFKRKYGTQLPPAWILMQVVSFGNTSWLFEQLCHSDIKLKIAREVGLPKHQFLSSWLRSISILRNIVAHHGRTWNANFAFSPALPKSDKNMAPWSDNFPSNETKKLYPILCAVCYLQHFIVSKVAVAMELKALLAAYPFIDAQAMGFPMNWDLEPLWQTG